MFCCKNPKNTEMFWGKKWKNTKLFGERDKQKEVLWGLTMRLKAAYTNTKRWLSGLWRELLGL